MSFVHPLRRRVALSSGIRKEMAIRGLQNIAAWFLIVLLKTALIAVASISEFDQGETTVFLGDRIVDAINCGGPEHTDIFGVYYRADSIAKGTASDHGKRYLFGRVSNKDQILYQTERYHTSDFDYSIVIPEDGQYVLVLKFSEVYFNAVNQKVFDVALNDINVIHDLDIFQRVGKAIAHDEYIPFSIHNGQLYTRNRNTGFPRDRKLKIHLLQGGYDNPKLNAFYIYKGSQAEVPKLPQLENHRVEEEEFEESMYGGRRHQIGDDSFYYTAEDEENRAKLASGPRTPDPYNMQDQSQMFIPILAALLCFFPVLFCLCKL